MRSLEQIIDLYNADAPLARGIHHSRGLVHRPARPGAGAPHGVRAQLAVCRPRRPAALAGRVHLLRASSRRAGRRRPRERRCAARLLQRLPPPRGGRGDRALTAPRVSSAARITAGPTRSRASSKARRISPASATSIARPTVSCRSIAAAGRNGSSSSPSAGGPVTRGVSRATIFRASFSARRSTACTGWSGARYTLDCNWKVFVDNYLDGGYHVPHLHKGLDSVLDYSDYTIENGERFCLQSSPMVSEGAEARTGAVRQGDRALYYWIYPNFMINCYGRAMDTNLVIPRGVDRTEVIFDFYFADVSEAARAANLASIAVSEQIQDEDVAICASVQRGLRSRAYTPAGCRCAAKPASICSTGSSARRSQGRPDARDAGLASERPAAARSRRRLRPRGHDRQRDRRRHPSRAGRGRRPSAGRLALPRRLGRRRPLRVPRRAPDRRAGRDDSAFGRPVRVLPPRARRVPGIHRRLERLDLDLRLDRGGLPSWSASSRWRSSRRSAAAPPRLPRSPSVVFALAQWRGIRWGRPIQNVTSALKALAFVGAGRRRVRARRPGDIAAER